MNQDEETPVFLLITLLAVVLIAFAVWGAALPVVLD